MSKLIVKIDPDLSDLIPGFLARKHQDVEAIRTSAKHRDYAAIGNLGHKIKGEGGSYGLDEISQIGEQLETAARKLDTAECLSLADCLSEYLNTVEIVFE